MQIRDSGRDAVLDRPELAASNRALRDKAPSSCTPVRRRPSGDYFGGGLPGFGLQLRPQLAAALAARLGAFGGSRSQRHRLRRDLHFLNRVVLIRGE